MRRRVSACQEKLPKTEDNQRRIIDARVDACNLYINLNYYTEAKDAVEPIIDLAERLNYRKRLAGIYTRHRTLPLYG